jgi:oligopeptidase B
VASCWPTARKLHGRVDTDDYTWMRDHEHPALSEYLAAERAYYDAFASRLADLTERLAAESVARIPAGAETSVSWPLSGFIYRTRTPEGRENLQLLRSQSGESAEQVLLDENILREDTGYIDVEDRLPSPDGTLLAWTSDTSGAEIFLLRIRDLATGVDLPDRIERSYPGLAWSADSRYLFYLVPDELYWPSQLWRHRLGTSAAQDELVYAEADAKFELILAGSRSGAYAIIASASRDTTEVRLIPLADPLADPILIRPRQHGTEYQVDHARGGSIYLVTDEDEPEYSLKRAPVLAAGVGDWALVDCPAVAPARSDTRLLSCAVVGDRLVLTLRRGGAPLLAITDLDGQNVIEVPAISPAGSIRIEHAEDYDAGSVILVEESLIEPQAWYRLELATGERELLKRREVPGYDAGRYRTERRLATASDGTLVPVTLAYHRETALDGSAPCLLYGYGAYEACADPAFSLGLASLLDRGVVYAIAHVRGGGEGGRNWWLQGRLRSKRTTFTDFIDVADWLAGDGDGPALVDGRRIVSRGLSAGGLLQGAVFSMRPDRWRAVVAEVPFVDCVTTMLDPSIPLTINEWDEWGDPRDKADYEYIKAYSPYDNPPAGERPALLVTGAVHDPRVAVHEPAKWVAKLRATADPDATEPLLFRVELGAGAHTGPSGRYARASYEAEVHAFILTAMGISS